MHVNEPAHRRATPQETRRTRLAQKTGLPIEWLQRQTASTRTLPPNGPPVVAGQSPRVSHHETRHSGLTRKRRTESRHRVVTSHARGDVAAPPQCTGWKFFQN